MTVSIDTQRTDWLAQMGAVLEVLNEGVVITDDRRRVVFANSHFLEMTGIAKDDLINLGPSSFYSPDEWNFVTRQMDVETRQGHNSYEFVLPRRDGSRLPVIVSSRMVQNAGTNFGIVTFADVSERVRVEKELRSANAKLCQRQQEIEEDLRLAAQVQKSLAPKSIIENNISIDSFYHAAHSIGGDFALAVPRNDGEICLIVCDVSGHGIGSALVANRIYTETAMYLRSEMSLTQIFANMNRLVMDEIDGSGMFVTAVAARVDAARRRMTFAGAGHPPAMLARRGQSPHLLEARSMILGMMPDAVDHENLEIQLQADDRVIFYTDGMTEVFNANGEMLGVSGLERIVNECSSVPGAEMKQRILDRVSDWREGAPTDDISLMVVHVR